MVGLPYDCLANPLGAVRLTFEKAVASGIDPATFDGKDWGATDLFRDFLYENDGLSQVPTLNDSTIRSLQPNTLVKFRGMIQDMLGNEFYVGAYKDGSVWRTNKFADHSQFPIGSSSDMRVWERRLLYCVPVPGQNSWTESFCQAAVPPFANSTSPAREKRQRENDVDMQDPDHEFQDSPSAKRKREESVPSQSSNLQANKIGETSSNTGLVPDFDGNSFPCLLKMYDSPESDLKLNDVFEFIGVLTFDTELKTDADEVTELNNSLYEEELTHLPPSKVPRIHCLVHRKLAVHDFLSSPTMLEPKPFLVKGIRETLLGHLTAVLGNDGLAAQFMLLHLLSRVHARVDTVAVGKLSLNLTCLNKESISIFGNRLNLAIRNLVPFAHSLPLTIDYLNSVSLAPRKDYQINRLVSGALQLAEGTHLTIDETQLQTGTLNSTGVDNARVLKSLTELQKVEYEFTYYKMDMAADIQMLILSEGKSNILPADLVLPLRPSSVDCYGDVDPELLKAWRWYLATMRSLPHSIEQEMQKVVEDDLVAARQADRSLGSQELSRLLTMGRLVSVSFGDTCLSLDHWQMVKELERLRRERLQGSV
ncbi:mini-chromosome maintenance complex-binding protein [Coffea eugenioides]|uniref:Mini-chromosome maintenance complex-binding protein n=1 Tax=Coffea arabica TaxID=13443 RepID=A0A6P6W6L9_COFAR|nr:mini-chromosome maintenance complex-binding protein [Coffea eugenioides]